MLTIAANYGGRWDIAQAARAYHRAHPEALAPGAPLDPDALAPYLAMAYAPEPDLFIRTGGEERISNFLLWQLAYAELHFTDAALAGLRRGGARRGDPFLPDARAPLRTHQRAVVREGGIGVSPLATRVATAVVLVPAVLVALFVLPPTGWALAVLVVLALAAHEWARLTGFAGGGAVRLRRRDRGRGPGLALPARGRLRRRLAARRS